MKQATTVLEQAVHDDAPAPFLFFACMQDAHAAMQLFLETRDPRPSEVQPPGDRMKFDITIRQLAIALATPPTSTNISASGNAAASTNNSAKTLDHEVNQLRGELAAQYQRIIQHKMDRAARSLGVLLKKAVEIRRSDSRQRRSMDQVIDQIKHIAPTVEKFVLVASQGADAEALLSNVDNIERLIRPIASSLGIDYEKL